jgi:signal peptidase I
MKKESIFNFIETFLVLILVILPVRFFLFEPFLVKGQSMEPNFYNYDYLIIDKLSYFFRNPERGEVIVFRPPVDKKVYYIKRIIGLPGERIEIKDSKIKIFNKENPGGFVLDEKYLNGHYTFGDLDITLSNDEYFVLGDNREVSYDSRKWGPVKKKDISGRVVFHFSLIKLSQALSR